jgi:hypothetical protein
MGIGSVVIVFNEVQFFLEKNILFLLHKHWGAERWMGIGC